MTNQTQMRPVRAASVSARDNVDVLFAYDVASAIDVASSVRITLRPVWRTRFAPSTLDVYNGGGVAYVANGLLCAQCDDGMFRSFALPTGVASPHTDTGYASAAWVCECDCACVMSAESSIRLRSLLMLHTSMSLCHCVADDCARVRVLCVTVCCAYSMLWAFGAPGMLISLAIRRDMTTSTATTTPPDVGVDVADDSDDDDDDDDEAMYVKQPTLASIASPVDTIAPSASTHTAPVAASEVLLTLLRALARTARNHPAYWLQVRVQS
jgi:hypothetical protein